MKAKQISLRELVEELNDHTGKNNFAFFLGAGASVSAGIPLASDMINEWKLNMYQKRCNSPNMINPYQEEKKKIPRQDILDWAAQYKKEKDETSGEYGFWFEEAFPTRQKRQDYIEEKISKAIDPTLEYYLFSQLIERNITNVIITVNFDDLVAEAIRLCNITKPLVIYDDSLMWNATARNIGKRPQVLKVHGDYLFNTMKNLDKETDKLPPNTEERLDDFLGQLGLVVIGYAGNDRSIMNTLGDIAKKTAGFRYGIYWCTFGTDLPAHTKAIEETNTEFFHIPNVDFLKFMLECQAMMTLDGMDKLSDKVAIRISKAKELLKTQTTERGTEFPDETQDIEELKQKAELAYFANEYEKAIEYFQRLEKISPKDYSLYFRWGYALSEIGQNKEAIEKYKKAIEYKPEYAEAYNNWGVALSDLGKNEEAIEKYKKAIEYKPDYADAYYNLGNKLSYLGRHEEAIEKYKKAVEYKPDYAAAYNNWGNRLSYLGKPEEAIEKYKKAIEYKPDYAAAYNNWGSTLSDLGKHEDAIEKYKKAIEYKLDYAEAYNNWGITLSALGKPEEAIEKYKKAIECKPDHEKAYYNTGRSFSLLKQKEEALKYLEKAISLDVTYKKKAKEDKDFEWLWEDAEFKKLTAE